MGESTSTAAASAVHTVANEATLISSDSQEQKQERAGERATEIEKARSGSGKLSSARKRT